MVAGVDNLVLLSKETLKKVHECEDCDTKMSNAKLTPGMREFEAWMRMLDAQVVNNTVLSSDGFKGRGAHPLALSTGGEGAKKNKIYPISNQLMLSSL